MVKTEVIFKVKLPACVEREDDLFVSCCPVLDVYSQGKTEKEALKNLGEAVKLFLLSCYERDTLSDVLKKCGFKPIRKPRVACSTAMSDFKEIKVDMPFMVGMPAHCHV